MSEDTNHRLIPDTRNDYTIGTKKIQDCRH